MEGRSMQNKEGEGAAQNEREEKGVQNERARKGSEAGGGGGRGPVGMDAYSCVFTAYSCAYDPPVSFSLQKE
jgi:hypothetical protein